MAVIKRISTDDLALPDGVSVQRDTEGVLERHDGTLMRLPAYCARLDGSRTVYNLLTQATDAYTGGTETVYEDREYRFHCDSGSKVVLYDGASVSVVRESSSDPFIMDFTVTDSETLTLPVSGTIAITVDWGDGSDLESFRAAPVEHTYTTGATYTVTIDGILTGFAFNDAGSKLNLVTIEQFGTTEFDDIDAGWFGCSNLTAINSATGDFSGVTNFNSAWYNNSLTSFPLIDTSSGTIFASAWRDNSLTSFPLIDTSSGTSFASAWYGNSLTSFPLIDTSSGTIFASAWRDNSLTSFPLIDTSSGTNFTSAWRDNSLTSFPLIDTSSVTSFASAWYGNSLTSFPLIDTSSGTNFTSAWYGNSLTTWPANMFDSCPATNFANAFFNNALDETGVDNILVSIDTAGQSNGTLDIDGGTNAPPGTAGLAAKTSLEGKGWTVTVNT